MASERYAGPVNDGELPGEVTSVSARYGGFTIGGGAARAASRVLPTPGFAAAAGAGPPAPPASGILASAALLFLASSTRL